jgi:alkylation response protein AidB-like acyl-CoA dehydrogenase
MQDLAIKLRAIKPNCMNKKLKLVASYGIFKHAIKQCCGGFGNQFKDLVEIHKNLGKSTLDSSLVLSINAHLWGAVFPIYHFGTNEQKNRYLKALVDGEMIGGHAITEAKAGSNILLMEARACNSGDFFIINGVKKYITNCTIMDIVVIYVRTEEGLNAIIIEKQDKGVSFKKSHTVTSFPHAPIGEIILDNCKVPSNRLLGRVNAGQMIIQKALELERAFIFASILGIMQWQLDEVLKYTKRRKINETYSIYDMQAINHKIAEISMKYRTIELWLNKCAELKDKNLRITIESACTKLFASEVFLQSSIEIAHIFGAFGLEIDQPYSQLVLDGLASTIFSGSSEIQKNIISSLL